MATLIRAWRDRLTPGEIGLPTQGDRRSPGLRREELSELAMVSVDYLVRLEQGRAQNPSPPVVAALAQALRLSEEERERLYLAAGLAPPATGSISSQLSPGLRRILARLNDTPVGVYTAAWDFVESNRLWDALFTGEKQRTGREANLVWRAFTVADLPIVWSEGQAAGFAREMVADLHTASARYPQDRELAALVTDLRGASPLFGQLWDEWRIGRRANELKTVSSPEVGPITLDCDVLSAVDSDLRLIVYTAEAGSADEEKLRLLRGMGSFR
nr:helix-turn-helix transcriptional regulator [Kineosporia babensis]